MMFNEVPFLDRFEAAAAAGFKGVEFLFPYEHPAAEIRRRLDDAGLSRCCSTRRPATGRPASAALACLPGRQAEFRDGISARLDYAGVLGSKLVHVMAGIPPPASLRHRRGRSTPPTWPGRRSRPRRRA